MLPCFCVSPSQLLDVIQSGTLLCGVTNRNSAPIPSSTRNRNSTRVGAQGFNQAILMSGRGYKILNLLIEFSNLIFIKIYFKAYWRWTCIQSKWHTKFLLFYAIYLSSRYKKTKMFQGFYPTEPLPELRHEPVEELTALRDPHLHFTTFENWIFVQKGTLVKLLG